MMNIDQARAGGEGLIQPKNQEKELKDLTNDPVFSSQERKLNIEVPEGWNVER